MSSSKDPVPCDTDLNEIIVMWQDISTRLALFFLEHGFHHTPSTSSFLNSLGRELGFTHGPHGFRSIYKTPSGIDSENDLSLSEELRQFEESLPQYPGFAEDCCVLSRLLQIIQSDLPSKKIKEAEGDFS